MPRIGLRPSRGVIALKGRSLEGGSIFDLASDRADIDGIPTVQLHARPDHLGVANAEQLLTSPFAKLSAREHVDHFVAVLGTEYAVQQFGTELVEAVPAHVV